MYDAKNIPARTAFSHYLRTGQRIDEFQSDNVSYLLKRYQKLLERLEIVRKKLLLQEGVLYCNSYKISKFSWPQ